MSSELTLESETRPVRALAATPLPDARPHLDARREGRSA
jgi:hypothetical protein